MRDTITAIDMPWVRYLNIRIRRALQIVMLFYLLIFLLPSYIYGMYLYSEQEMHFSEQFNAISQSLEFIALFLGIFVLFAARFVAVPVASALLLLIWVGWDSLTHNERCFSILTGVLTIVAIPLTTVLSFLVDLADG